MARGWESKSVEGQIESFESERRRDRNEISAEELERQRRREGLLLSRARVLHDLERSRQPRYRKILLDSLSYLEAKIKETDPA